MNDRLPAVPVAVRDLLEGRFERRDALPNSIVTRYGSVSRVNIIGILVDVFSEDEALLDDGSGSVEIRSSWLPIGVKVGSPVLVIGTVREGVWIAVEIVREVSPGWLRVRRDALAHRPEREIDRGIPVVHEVARNPNDVVLRAIKDLDQGNGVDVEDLSAHVHVSDFDAVLDALVKEGEVYEIKGKVRVLK